MKKLALITINNPGIQAGIRLGEYLKTGSTKYDIHLYAKPSPENSHLDYQNHIIHYNDLDELFSEIWSDYDIILAFLATGIVIRKMARLLESKYEDPAVLIMSFNLERIIPLLSGHLGGANAFADELTGLIPNCVNFITTATDQTDSLAFDLFAQKHSFYIQNSNQLAKISNNLINKQPVNVITYSAIMDLLKQTKGYRPDLLRYADIEETVDWPDISGESVIISPLPYYYHHVQEALRIKIAPLYFGMGMDRGVSWQTLYRTLKRFLWEHQLCLSDIKAIASFKAKSDEKGLLELSERLKTPLRFFSDDDINSLPHQFSESRARDFFNIKGVAEPSAILASKYKSLFLRKHVYPSVTIAAAV